MSAEIEPRLTGIELELAQDSHSRTLVDDDRQRIGIYAVDGSRMATELPEGVEAYRPSNATTFNFFLGTGARYYIDFGNLEYASPECLSFSDVVRYQMAAHQLMANQFETETAKSIYEYAAGYARVVDHQPEPHTLGAHENYFSRVLSPGSNFKDGDLAAQALATHLITRSIYTGAGSVDHQGIFHKTQKLRTLGDTVSSGTFGERKPIINTRPEHHASNGQRIHVVTGDHNISPWATWMKLGTTSIVLRLIEHDEFPPEALVDWERVVPIARTIGSTASLAQKIETDQGQAMTALEAQEIIWRAAADFMERRGLPDEEAEVLQEWEEVLVDLGTDPELCADRIDWICSRHAIDRVEGVEDRILQDLKYVKLFPGLGRGLDLRERGWFRRTPTAQEVSMAHKEPPVDTRAAVRGHVVRMFNKGGNDGSIDWARIHMFAGGKTLAFPMLDPFDNNIDKFQEWYDENTGVA